VNEALKSIGAVLNLLAAHYFDSETRFDLGARHNGSVELLYALHAGVKAQDERLKRIQDGKPLDGDFDPQDL
jgi:hypothetical protein